MVATRRSIAATKKEVSSKAASKPAKKVAAPVQEASESESEEDQDDQEDSDDEDQDDEDDDEDEEEEDEEEEEEEEADTFKIHTPKAASAPRVAPAALPTITYEDDESESDSDAAPEAESLSSAKEKILSAQDKEKSFLSKVQAEQKAKRVERDQKLKAQKEQSKSTKAKKQPTITQPEEAPEQEETPKSKSGLPAMLPMDILESVAEMDDQEASGALADSKKRKHMRPEDFALMELEAELRAEALKRKKSEKTQKNVGPVTVKVLDQSHLAKGHAVPETIVDFRKQHFYGNKIQRKDAVLNMSQKNNGAASKFSRRK